MSSLTVRPKSLAADAANRVKNIQLMFRRRAVSKDARSEAQLNALLRKLQSHYDELAAMANDFDAQDAEAAR